MNDKEDISRLRGTPFPSEMERLYRKLGRKPINLHRALAPAPAVLEKYLELVQSLRFEAKCPQRDRELAICRVARLRGSDYEWAHHSPEARHAGVSEEQLNALDEWRASSLFADRDRVILGYVDYMVVDAKFDSRVLEQYYDEQEQVELTMTIGMYLSIAAVLRALEVQLDDNVGN